MRIRDEDRGVAFVSLMVNLDEGSRIIVCDVDEKSIVDDPSRGCHDSFAYYCCVLRIITVVLI